MPFSIPPNWQGPILQQVIIHSNPGLAIAEFHHQERRNVKIIQQVAGSTQNPYLLSEQEEKSTVKKHDENKKRLRVPRRPPWTKSMTTLELDNQEKAAFLDWRRGLATYVGNCFIAEV
jgi:hypothetical protein